jgi:hypothetical protein
MLNSEYICTAFFKTFSVIFFSNPLVVFINFFFKRAFHLHYERISSSKGQFSLKIHGLIFQTFSTSSALSTSFIEGLLVTICDLYTILMGPSSECVLHRSSSNGEMGFHGE